MEETEGAPRDSRIERWFTGTRPSALAILSGRRDYAHHLRNAQLRFLAAAMAGTVIAAAVPGTNVEHFHAGWLFALLGVAAVAATVVFNKRIQPSVSLYAVCVAIVSPVLVLMIWLVGPNLELSTAVIPTVAAGLFAFYPRRAAVILVGLMMAAYGLVLATAGGYPRPVQRWLLILGFVIAAAQLFDYLVSRVQEIVERERAVHRELGALHGQLADANLELEARVSEQVEEVERLGRLRRFVTPQIAETLMSRDAESMLATHRKQIAVLMVDLRGFTRFSATAEPEDVVEVLNDYFGVVGKAVEALGATGGGFAGDGVLVYFNDPFPVEDPPGKALSMAAAMRGPMNALGERWARHGFKVGYGIGIAYGYATLSTIGFETRSEYTAIGPVVNLAARLCDHAAPGEVLLDARAYEAVRDRVVAEPVALELKGFDGEVTAYRASLDSVVS